MFEKFFKKTKIVATLGPATDNEVALKALIKAGANVFRLNTSHGSMEHHRETMHLIKRVMDETKAHVAIMVDLQGPKIRIGNLSSEIVLQDGEEIIFKHSIAQEEGLIPVDYEGICNDVSPGGAILIDDGKIGVRVERVENNRVYATVTNGGILKSRKGLNIPGSTASLAAVTERDVEFIKFAIEEDADYVALSFVRQKEDVILAKKYMEEFGKQIPIIAKIEKPDAIINLKEIVSESDAVMVARGDLGIELSPYEVPICQKTIIEEATKQRKPVIVATQMLESMISEPIPTRAEASDVANAILDGADAVMLSGETSVGKYAIEAVQTMSKIARNVEQSEFYKFNSDGEISADIALTRQAIAYGADNMLKYVDAKALVTFSHFGYSARLMSKLKPSVPIIMVSDLESTCRRSALNWGVHHYCKQWDSVMDQELLIKIDEFLINEVGLKDKDYVVITGSAPVLISGKTNFVRVHRIGT